MINPHPALAELWQLAGANPAALARVSFSNTTHSLPSIYQVGTLAAATIAAQALAAAGLWQLRGGEAQDIGLDVRHALALFRSERYLRVDGKAPADPWSPLAGFYRTGDDRWIQLHTNFPHHRDGVLQLLQCEDSRAAVADAILGWNAVELDSRLADAGMCAALIRTPWEWQEHPQAAAVAALPLFEIIKIGDAPPEAPGRGLAALRPLSGVRVLDLSRVIAAPVAARTLAQHGADVLAVSAAHLPNILPAVMDTGRGKRATQLDLREAAGRERLLGLVQGADVFLQAYRPGALAGLGFTPETLCALRPGLVQVALSAYGHTGPWATRRGFDSLTQSATGIAYEEGKAAGLDGPGKLPCQALDHATGYLAAFGAMIALQRRATEGGSWLVRVSLAQTGRWLQAMGTDPAGLAGPELGTAEITGWMQRMESPFGRLSAIAPAERMSRTPPHFALPAVPLDTHSARWVD